MSYKKQKIVEYIIVIYFCCLFSTFTIAGCKSDFILCQIDEDCPSNMVCGDKKYCIYSGDVDLREDVEVKRDDTGDKGCKNNEDCYVEGVCEEPKCDLGKHICETVFKKNDFICRPPKSFCDLPEHCTGKSADCPQDISYILGQIGNRLFLNDRYTYVYEPKIVSNGTEYAVVWYSKEVSNCDMFISRVSRDGKVLGTEYIIERGSGNCWMQSIIWNGKEYALVWSDNRKGLDDIYFLRLNQYGKKIGEEIKVAGNPKSNAYNPKIVWDGNGYGIIWEDNSEEDLNLYFVRIDESGKRTTDDIRLSYRYANNYYGLSSISYDGNEFLILWAEQNGNNTEINFSKIDKSGTYIKKNIKLVSTMTNSWSPSIVWNGNEYGIIWLGSNDNDVEATLYFSRLDRNGNKLISDIEVDKVTNVSGRTHLFFENNSYYVLWRKKLDRSFQVNFYKVDRIGKDILGGALWEYYSRFSYNLSIANIDNEFGIVWDSADDGVYNINFSRVGCLPPK